MKFDIKFKDESEKYDFSDLVKIVGYLRAPGGCPWDREQTHESIKSNLIEEGYELIEAIDGKDPAKIADESGDLLLQVVFHAIIAEDNGEYEINDVTDAICRKLIHRHPHVFGDVSVSGSGEVLKNWDAIKRGDRSQESIADEMRGVSKYLPSLMRCAKIRKKAVKNGFSYDARCADDTDSFKKCGEALFRAVETCAECGVDPELALSAYTDEYIDKFEEFEKNKNIK